MNELLVTLAMPSGEWGWIKAPQWLRIALVSDGREHSWLGIPRRPVTAPWDERYADPLNRWAQDMRLGKVLKIHRIGWTEWGEEVHLCLSLNPNQIMDSARGTERK